MGFVFVKVSHIHKRIYTVLVNTRRFRFRVNKVRLYGDKSKLLSYGPLKIGMKRRNLSKH